MFLHLEPKTGKNKKKHIYFFMYSTCKPTTDKELAIKQTSKQVLQALHIELYCSLCSLCFTLLGKSMLLFNKLFPLIKRKYKCFFFFTTCCDLECSSYMRLCVSHVSHTLLKLRKTCIPRSSCMRLALF